MVVDFMQSWLRFRIGDLSDYLSSPLVMVFAGFRESVESKEHCDIWYSIVVCSIALANVQMCHTGQPYY